MAKFLKIFIVNLFLVFELYHVAFGFALCPDPSVTGPCECIVYSQFGLSGVICEGSNVTQQIVAKTFKAIRTVNKVPEGEVLSLDQFNLVSSEMTDLDLTPLLNSQIGVVHIKLNPQLSRIHLPSSSNSSGTFRTPILFVYENNFTDSDSVYDLLKLTGDSLTQLDLADNKLTDSTSGGSLVEGLEFLPNLSTLHLGGNRIRTIKGGQFKRNGRLRYLILSQNNITEIGENAFELEVEHNRNEPLVIYLEENNLTSSSFTSSSAFSKINRSTSLALESNNLETLDYEIFHPFLTAHPQNILYARKNQFVCNENMKWLKEGQSLYESHASGLNCVNDPGNTIFTTDCV